MVPILYFITIHHRIFNYIGVFLSKQTAVYIRLSQMDTDLDEAFEYANYSFDILSRDTITIGPQSAIMNIRNTHLCVFIHYLMMKMERFLLLFRSFK